MLKLDRFVQNPSKYPYRAINKKTGQEVAYYVVEKPSGRKYIKAVVPTAGGILTFKYEEFWHFYNRALDKVKESK